MIYQQLSRIELLMQTKKYNEAKKLINECLSDYPDLADLYGLICRIALAEGDKNKALGAINTAISLAADEGDFRYLKSVALTEMAELESALEEINVAIELEPDIAVYYGHKGYILLRKNNKPEAIRWARHGKSIDPTNETCTNVLSLALSASGARAEADEVLGEMLEEDPDNDFTLSTAGYNALRSGDIPRAKQLFQSALMIDPDSHYARASMMEAIKGTNFFYRKILQYSAWMAQKSDGMQWAYIIGILLLVRVLPFLVPVYMIFILWVWFAPPLANVVLYLDKHGRYLMDEEMSKITLVNLILVAVSLVSLALGLVAHTSFLGMAFALFIAIIPLNMVHDRVIRRNKIAMLIFGVAFISLGILGMIMGLSGNDSSAIWSVLIFGVIGFTWLSNMFRR